MFGFDAQKVIRAVDVQNSEMSTLSHLVQYIVDARAQPVVGVVCGNAVDGASPNKI